MKTWRATAVALALTTAWLPGSAAHAAGPNAYVALGDSYTSAPFVPVPTGKPIDCGQSTMNYPHLVAKAIKPPVFRDVSCGSAETKHFTEPQTGLPLGGTNPPQFNALNANVKLVTVGIGGNDIGFGGIADNCVQVPTAAGGTPCRDHYVHDGHDELRDRITADGPVIAHALQQIHTLAPSAAVLVVGYPAIVPDHGPGCYPYLPVLPTDVAYLRGVEKALNAMLRDAALGNGAAYVDWYGPSVGGLVGHDACKPPGIAWVNGAVLVPPSYPAHPNQLGTAGAARAVERVLSRLHVHF